MFLIIHLHIFSYLFVRSRSVRCLIAVHGSVQPVPVPLTSPTSLQALFTASTATLTWEAPPRPALMGKCFF